MSRLITESASKSTIRERFLSAVLRNVVARCSDPEDKRYENYGGLGIQSDLSIADMEFLYERDRPDLMVRPSLDRKDNDGPYIRDNCQFLEMWDNAAKRTWSVQRPCSKCGVVGLSRKINGRHFCTECWKAQKVELGRFPRFVKYIFEVAEKQGFQKEPLVNDAGVVSPIRALIAGRRVSFHCARIPVRTSKSSTVRYWRFSVHNVSSDFLILAARNRAAYRLFIIPHDALNSPWVYIPVRGRGSQWQQFKDAWHLFATPAEVETRKAS